MRTSQEPVLSNEDVAVLLAEIQRIEDPYQKATNLTELASQLLPSRSAVLQQALEAATVIQYESDRTDVLSAIAPQLPYNHTGLWEASLKLSDENAALVLNNSVCWQSKCPKF